jgi:hypothetical protein
MEIFADSVLVTGCVHADYSWFAERVLPTAAENEVDAVLVTGDFGFWRDRKGLIQAATTSLARWGVKTWFIDGNHEEHPYLAAEVRKARVEGEPERSPVSLGGSLTYIPRGGRFMLGDLSGLGCGGARSIDELFRTAGYDWFLEEVLSEADVAAATAGGHADLLVTHDAPRGWNIPGLIPLSEMAPEWRAVIEQCWAHQALVREVFEAATPATLVHGHFHTGYDMTVEESWGPVRVLGLDHGGKERWGKILSTHDGQLTVSDWVTAIKRRNLRPRVTDETLSEDLLVEENRS